LGDEIHWGGARCEPVSDGDLPESTRGADGCCGWARKRTQATLRRGLASLGAEVVAGLRYVCSDMWVRTCRCWRPGGARLHVVDRFHVVMHVNQAVDQVRRGECARLRGRRKPGGSSGCAGLCSSGSGGAGARAARPRLGGAAGQQGGHGAAWLLKDCFEHLWHYKSGRFGARRIWTLGRRCCSAWSRCRGGADGGASMRVCCSTGFGPGGGFQRGGGGAEQQDSSGYQTGLRVPDVPRHGNSLYHTLAGLYKLRQSKCTRRAVNIDSD